MPPAVRHGDSWDEFSTQNLLSLSILSKHQTHPRTNKQTNNKTEAGGQKTVCPMQNQPHEGHHHLGRYTRLFNQLWPCPKCTRCLSKHPHRSTQGCCRALLGCSPASSRLEFPLLALSIYSTNKAYTVYSWVFCFGLVFLQLEGCSETCSSHSHLHSSFACPEL